VKRPYLRLLAAALAVLAALPAATPGPAVGAQPARRTVARIGEPTTFTLSSFNVLGSNHTTSSSRFASGLERIGLAVKLLDKHGVDVVGFQELQLDQFTEFYRLAGTRYGVYPGGVDRRTVQNSIAWNLASWQFVSGETVPIPYFKGEEYQMPVVLLQSVTTGQLAYFANFHNPATNKRHPGNATWRAEATRREVALANSLYYETGLPVFVTGDMNEREEYFCAMAGGAPMRAANGGKFKNGVCTPPPYPMPVDWIFGARGRSVFSNYVRDDSKLVNKITDHFVIRADVAIPAAVDLTP
jgi:endonuclease/exonuclease/phosphatase family protein